MGTLTQGTFGPKPVQEPGQYDQELQYFRADQVTKQLYNAASTFQYVHGLDQRQAEDAALHGAIDFIAEILSRRPDGRAEAQTMGAMLNGYVTGEPRQAGAR